MSHRELAKEGGGGGPHGRLKNCDWMSGHSNVLLKIAKVAIQHVWHATWVAHKLGAISGHMAEG